MSDFWNPENWIECGPSKVTSISFRREEFIIKFTVLPNRRVVVDFRLGDCLCQYIASSKLEFPLLQKGETLQDVAKNNLPSVLETFKSFPYERVLDLIDIESSFWEDGDWLKTYQYVHKEVKARLHVQIFTYYIEAYVLKWLYTAEDSTPRNAKTNLQPLREVLTKLHKGE